MLQMKSGWLLGTALAALAALSGSLPAHATNTVRDGVEAWSRGDYTAAVSEWRGPAEAGDPDAMFNLGQAYRLGRGVTQDLGMAEQLYARAAQAGHVQAADIYGLMLFQDGRREAALPFVQAAARRGDPRAQYLLGIAHFNGDLVARDWVLAYALMTLANSAGLPQAVAAISEMDVGIPLDQRQSAAGLARELEAAAEQARSVELAAADLAVQQGPSASGAASSAAGPVASQAIPRPIPSVSVSPSVAAAQDAVRQARQATGTGSPADAGASFANAAVPRQALPPVREVPAPSPTGVTAPRSVAATSAPAPVPASSGANLTRGPWRVQLGAFGVAGNAERLWSRLSSRSELAGRERLLIPTGRVTRLLAGGYASQSEAQTACNSLRRSGQDCLVTRN
ncbi:SPOR domain-containing protein [Aurantiacibacter marinus]|nr:SPOR domain-containing protein [Aurantiacibacter marinus]